MSEAAAAYLRDAVLQTLGIACASFTIALLIGTPLAFIIAREGPIARAVAAVASVIRAIPDLVLAIVFVVALGLGPAAAIVALGLHYGAVIAKMFTDVAQSVRREPAEALRATGATAGTAILLGLIPVAWPGIVGFGVYAFESIVRASVIVGVVGAGGVGTLLIQQLNFADYRGFIVSVAVLTVLIIAIEQAGVAFRRHASPRVVALFLAAVALCGVAVFAFTPDPPWRLIATAPQHLASYAAHAVPQWNAAIAQTAFSGVAICVVVAMAGTVFGALLALPLALLVAWPVARGWMRGTGWRPYSAVPEIVSRGALAVVRAIPPVALGLVGVVFIGIGPVAGAFALVLHTAGVLGKLAAESFDVAELGPAEALAASGATGTATTLVALVPSALGTITAHLLYRFEWNIRASTVLGMVGAGGLGQAIFNAQQLLFYGQLSTYVLFAIALVLIVDAAGSRLRHTLRLSRMAL